VVFNAQTADTNAAPRSSVNYPRRKTNVKAHTSSLAGFYVMARPQDLPRPLTECDPLLVVWLSYVRARGSDPRRPYLLIRSLLSRALGERQGPEWAACVLDAKRAYLENPRTVAVFTAIREHASIPQAVRNLGFELEPSLTVSIGQSLIHAAVLPFGPHGPMHWMLEFVGSDLSPGPVGSSKPHHLQAEYGRDAWCSLVSSRADDAQPAVVLGFGHVDASP
jgi:hypothetical protein